MANRNSIQKIIIHSSKVGSQNIDKISFIKVSDTDVNNSNAVGKYCIEKEAVNKKKSNVKYSKLLNLQKCEETDYSPMNNMKKVDEDDERSSLMIVGDLPGHTPFHRKKRSNRLSTFSKPDLINTLKRKIDKLNLGQKSEKIEKEKSPKKLKNHTQKTNPESRKKYQIKESTIQNEEDVKPLIIDTEIEKNEVTLLSTKIINPKSTNKVNASKLKRNTSFHIPSYKDFSTIFGKETLISDHNATDKIKQENLNEIQAKEENEVTNTRKDSKNSCKKRSVINEKSQKAKCDDYSSIYSPKLQKIKMEPVKTAATMESKTIKSKKKSSIIRVPVTRQISGISIDPSIDIRSVKEEVLSNSKHKPKKRAKIETQKIVASKVDNSVGSKSKETKIKNEDGLRRSNRLSLLPGVRYTEK